MDFWPIGIFESGGSLSIAKCIVVLVVLLLLMYTCQQAFGNHYGSPREAVGRDHTKTKTTVSPENITDTAENVTTKRRRQRKKGKTKNSDDQEPRENDHSLLHEPNGGHKAREKSGKQGKGEKLVVVEILKRDAFKTGHVSGNAGKTAAVNDDADGWKKTEHVAAKPSESSCATVSFNGVIVDEECDKFVGRNGGKALGSDDAESCEFLGRHEIKHKKACKKDVALKGATKKSTKEEVKSVVEGPRKLFTNAVCLVLDQVAVCEKKKPREVNSPRNPNLVSEGERKIDAARIEDSNAGYDGTPRKQKQTAIAYIADSHVTDCDVTDRQEGRAVPSKCRNKGRTCFGGSSKGHQSSASANTHDKTKGTAARRRSFDRNVEKSRQHLSNIDQTRQAGPFDRSLGMENDCHLNQSQRRRRSSDSTSKGDRRESESHQNDRFCANGKKIRRRSVDAASEDDHRVIERPENYRQCEDEAQRRKTSSDSDATGIELSECHRDCQTEDLKTGRFSDYPTENVSRRNDSKQQPIDHQRGRRSVDRFSENDSRGIEGPKTNRDCDEDQRRRKASDNCTTGSELLKNRRNYQTENLRRQRPSNHYSENDSKVNGSFRKHQHRADHRRRRGSSDEISENPQHRRENRRRRESFDCTSENDPVHGEILENSRHQPDDRRRRRSFDRTPENELSQGEIHENFRHRPNNRTRRRYFGRTSESDSIQGENPENPRRRPDNRRRRRSYDNTAETEPGRSKPQVNRRRFDSDNRDYIESEWADEYTRVGFSTEPSTAVYEAVMNPNPTVDDEVFDVASTMDEPHVAEVKDTNVGQQTSSGSPQSQFKIDPAVRERLLNPKYPVIVPDRPLEHISYRDKNWRPEEIRGANKSLVGGVFGSKWRREMEKKEREQEMKELAEEEERKAELKKWSDNICPTFMVWGVCHRGDNCPLRHPSYRYLERPPRKKESSESRPEKQKSDPNSYAAVLGKSPEPKEFFNEAVLLDESKTEVDKISFANVLVNSQRDRETSKVPVPKTSYEEAWPSLGSPVKGQGKVPSQATVSGPKAWSTQKGPWIPKEQNSETSNLQTVSDAVIAQELQADEYMQMEPEEYDDYSNYPEEDYDYNEESYYYQEPDINDDEENQRWFTDSRHQTKVLELEEFNSRLPTSPVITKQESTSPRESIPQQVQDSPCDICMDRPKDATLVCGHRFCYQCALQMRLDERVCAICRRCIVSVIKTYN